MKKICLVTMGNIFSAPYIHKYINARNEHIEIDIIYWNIENVKEEIDGVKLIAFETQRNKKAGKIGKVIEYLKFRKFLKEKLKTNNYGGVIFLQTISSILVHNYIKKNFKNKYIVDVRDYTYENNIIFKKILKGTIKKSFGVVISSDGYKNFLPNYKYILAHNTPENFDELIKLKTNNGHAKNEKIVISYIGVVRFKSQIYKFIDRFKNDERFLLRFIGAGANDLKKYCIDNEVLNVDLIDYFHPSETLKFYKETDLVYNLYGNNTPLLDYALSNKLYYASMLNKPILVCPRTHMEEVSYQYSFGLTVDLDDLNCNNVLYNQFINIDFKLMNKNTRIFNEKVTKDNEVYNSFIKNFYKRIIDI